MNISIAFDTKALVANLHGLQQELPSVVNNTINGVLREIQTDEVKHINDVFTVRRPAFVKRSVKITKFSNKQDFKGTIQIADMAGKKTADVLNKFEVGGRKTASGGNLAIPLREARGGKNAIVPSGKRPANLPRSFKLEAHGKTFIAQHYGSKKNPKTRFMYALKKSVPIDHRLGFVRIGEATIARELDKHIQAALTRALAKHQLTP